jgi:hypothetical protein
MSRGREANHVYTSTTALTGERAGIEIDVPSFEPMTGPDPAHVLSRLRERLTANRRHILASHQQPWWRPPRPDREPYRPNHGPTERDLGRTR